MAKKIYIGQLSGDTTESEITKHFSQVGKVSYVKVATGINPQKSAGYGYVEMSSEEETEKAIKKLNNSLLDGRRIKVVEAHYLDQERTNYRFRNIRNRRFK